MVNYLPIGAIRCWKEGNVYRNFIKIKTGTKNANKNFIRYARYLMEKKLGRKLKENEIVHHINEITVDDRIENLKLISISEHISKHNKGKIPIIGIKAASEYRRNIRKKHKPFVEKLYNENVSMRGISRKLGISRATVKKILMEEN